MPRRPYDPKSDSLKAIERAERHNRRQLSADSVRHPAGHQRPHRALRRHGRHASATLQSGRRHEHAPQHSLGTSLRSYWQELRHAFKYADYLSWDPRHQRVKRDRLSKRQNKIRLERKTSEMWQGQVNSRSGRPGIRDEQKKPSSLKLWWREVKDAYKYADYPRWHPKHGQAGSMSESDGVQEHKRGVLRKSRRQIDRAARGKPEPTSAEVLRNKTAQWISASGAQDPHDAWKTDSSVSSAGPSTWQRPAVRNPDRVRINKPGNGRGTVGKARIPRSARTPSPVYPLYL